MMKQRHMAALVLVAVLYAALLLIPVRAGSYKYESQAVTLNNLGLMAGMNLGDTVTRIQGLTFAIKAAGRDAEVQSISDEEASSILAAVTDRSDIPEWGRKYAAYAIKKKYTTGIDASIAPKIKFAAMQPVSGASFMTWLLKIGMQYEGVGTNNAIEYSVGAKVITFSQVFSIAMKDKLIRDDVAGILFGAAKTGVNSDGKSFTQALVDAGFIDGKAAADAGLLP